MNKQKKIIKVALIIKESKLSLASFANKGLPAEEFDDEVIRVAEKIAKTI